MHVIQNMHTKCTLGKIKSLPNIAVETGHTWKTHLTQYDSFAKWVLHIGRATHIMREESWELGTVRSTSVAQGSTLDTKSFILATQSSFNLSPHQSFPTPVAQLDSWGQVQVPGASRFTCYSCQFSYPELLYWFLTLLSSLSNTFTDFAPCYNLIASLPNPYVDVLALQYLRIWHLE